MLSINSNLDSQPPLLDGNNKLFALIDCNNFYASCERAFNPALLCKPVVVLSNNDGCIIARSNEAKALGVPMGAPFFKYKKLMLEKRVHVFSSNYTYYGNMSDRVMRSLAMMVPDMEIYSIDEAFFRLDKLNEKDLVQFCSDIRRKINQWLSIPTSVGIAPTKTLAKIANNIAKKQATSGVFDMREKSLQDEILSKLPLEEIWGISKGSSSKLYSIGVNSALSLRDSDSKLIRQVLGVVGERIVYELRGISCLEIQEVTKKKNIMTSRSFGRKITSKTEMREAIANYAIRACEKLHDQKSRAKAIHVFVQTNPFNQNAKQYNCGLTKTFISPTNITKTILQSALKIMDEIFIENLNYKKAGIMLLDLVNEDSFQGSLFASNDLQKNEKNSKIEDAMKEINVKVGKGSIFYATQGIKRSWAMQSNKRSKEYTTNSSELAEVF